MTLAQFHALQTDQGTELLRQLADEPLAESDLLPVLERYRRQYPVELVNAAVGLIQLRRRAGGKFSRAAEMFFTRDGLEMASAEPVARYTAQRFAGLPYVMDLCCGIGGDALALASAARKVTAVDRDPLALEMARSNARIAALHDRLDFVQAEVTEFIQKAPLLLGRPSAIFVDPSRRETAAAAKRPEHYSPPLSWCLILTSIAPRVGIKVSPALDYDAALAGIEAEVEIISLRGECKEAMLWLGDFRTGHRRATLLPADNTLTDDGPTSDALGDIGAWIYEPDPAVIRAHLVQRLAGAYDLRRIDPDIAYLTGDRQVASPFMVGYHVTEVIPWSLKRLNASLQARGIGKVTIKKRGFPLTPEELHPKLKRIGSRQATLICTRALGKPVVILVDMLSRG